MQDSLRPLLKSVVLAAGQGRRAEKALEGRNKCLLPVKGRPLMEYGMGLAARLGPREMIIVIGYRGNEVRNAFGDQYRGIPLRYVVQDRLSGCVDAMVCCREHLQGAPFVLSLGDEYFSDADSEGMLDAFCAADAFALCGAVPIATQKNKTGNYSLVYRSRTRRVLRAAEKPDKPLGKLMGTGLIIFDGRILDYADATPVNPATGEKDLAALLQCAIEAGKKVLCHPLASAEYVNLNSADDLETIEAMQARASAAPRPHPYPAHPSTWPAKR